MTTPEETPPKPGRLRGLTLLALSLTIFSVGNVIDQTIRWTDHRAEEVEKLIRDMGWQPGEGASHELFSDIGPSGRPRFSRSHKVDGTRDLRALPGGRGLVSHTHHGCLQDSGLHPRQQHVKRVGKCPRHNARGAPCVITHLRDFVCPHVTLFSAS